MTQKVQVSREVANALDVLREKFSDDRVLSVIAREKTKNVNCRLYGERISNAIEAIRTRMSPIETAKSLINGYEVDETPENKFTEWYRNLDAYKYNADNLKRIGADTTLELLGLKIEGVNA